MHDDKPVTFHIGHEELRIRQRYEALSIGNDVLMALWFLVGSVLFFWESTMTGVGAAGTLVGTGWTTSTDARSLSA